MVDPAYNATSPCSILVCGADRNRTDDLLLAKQVLYQLSYRPSKSNATSGAWMPPLKGYKSD